MYIFSIISACPHKDAGLYRYQQTPLAVVMLEQDATLGAFYSLTAIAILSRWKPKKIGCPVLLARIKNDVIGSMNVYAETGIAYLGSQ